jgi:hypothetical protein
MKSLNSSVPHIEMVLPDHQKRQDIAVSCSVVGGAVSSLMVSTGDGRILSVNLHEHTVLQPQGPAPPAHEICSDLRRNSRLMGFNWSVLRLVALGDSSRTNVD